MSGSSQLYLLEPLEPRVLLSAAVPDAVASQEAVLAAPPECVTGSCPPSAPAVLLDSHDPVLVIRSHPATQALIEPRADLFPFLAGSALIAQVNGEGAETEGEDVIVIDPEELSSEPAAIAAVQLRQPAAPAPATAGTPVNPSPVTASQEAGRFSLTSFLLDRTVWNKDDRPWMRNFLADPVIAESWPQSAI